jgi:hypothetical protein
MSATAAAATRAKPAPVMPAVEQQNGQPITWLSSRYIEIL